MLHNLLLWDDSVFCYSSHFIDRQQRGAVNLSRVRRPLHQMVQCSILVQLCAQGVPVYSGYMPCTMLDVNLVFFDCPALPSSSLQLQHNQLGVSCRVIRI